jgi:hypothetical protein
MFWKTSILAGGLWAAALSAQTVPPSVTIVPRPLTARAKAENALRDLMKQYSQPNEPAVCSIPLLEVPVKKDVDAMPQLLPPAGSEKFDNIDRMPAVKLPAPPCGEEKR